MVSSPFRLIIIAALGLSAARAQLPVARLLTISPAGGQIGTTFEASVSGTDLDELAELRFLDANVSAKPKTNSVTGFNEPNKFVVTISSNAVAGVTEVRAVGRFGISNPRAFAIGYWPEKADAGGNFAASSATNITVGSTINGQADANAIDHWRFTAKKGQRILIECRAKGIDSRMDPSMVLYDGAGRELARARNQELIDFAAAEEGTNLLKVSDFLYRGGPEFFYRLSIHTGPRVDFVFPPAAIAGRTNKHIVYGRNLPGGTPAPGMSIGGRAIEQLAVEIAAPKAAEQRVFSEPAALPVRGFHYRLAHGGAEPFFIGLAEAPVVLEQPANDRAEAAQKVTPPCEYVGQLYPAGDQDWLAFEAKKGEVYSLEIFSRRLEAPTDAMLVVQRLTKTDKGEVKTTDVQEANDLEASIGGQEFKTSSFDPAMKLEVKEDGTYCVEVRDLFNRTTSDPRHVYRLAIRKESPDFQLAALPQLPATKKEREVAPWSTVLRRGETASVRVLALRENGFGGDITVGVEGLPPEVAAGPAKIESGKNSTLLFLTASPTASNWSGGIKIVGKGKQGESEMVREAVAGTTVWRVEDYNTEAAQTRVTPAITLAIAPEPVPIAIAITATNVLEATAGAKLAVPLTLVRSGEFTEKLKIKVGGPPALDSVKEIEVDGKATNATFEIDLGQAKLGAGTYTLHFHTQTKGKYSNNPEGAKQAEAAAKEAETTAASAAAEAKKAGEAASAAAKAAVEADAMAKAAVDKLAAAKTASEANAADQKLTAAKVEADKIGAAAAAKAKEATEAKVATEKTSAELAAKATSAEARKTALAARAKEMVERAKPKDVTIAVYSQPFEVKVNPAPATAKK
jgi:hypothetical protein